MNIVNTTDTIKVAFYSIPLDFEPGWEIFASFSKLDIYFMS